MRTACSVLSFSPAELPDLIAEVRTGFEETRELFGLGLGVGDCLLDALADAAQTTGEETAA